MSGPIFASLSFADLPGRAEIAKPPPIPRRQSGDRHHWFGTMLHLSCAAAAGAVTAGALFAAVGYALTVTDKALAPSGLSQLQDAKVPVAGAPDAASAVTPDDDRTTLRTQPAPTVRPLQSAKPIEAAVSAAGARAPLRTPLNQPTQQNRPVNSSATVVTGPVGQAADAMTWIVGGEIVHLWGVRPNPRTPPAAFEDFVQRVAAEGPLACHRQAYSSRYRCLTATGGDVAEMALSSGLGQAPDARRPPTATPRQRRSKRAGLWSSR
jgi:hypothetical protein